MPFKTLPRSKSQLLLIFKNSCYEKTRSTIILRTLQCLIREGKASIVTGHIDHITEGGIKMKSGEHVDADLIISATGINLQRNFPFSTIKAEDLFS